MNNRTLLPAVLVLAGALAAGCASLKQRDDERERSEARADHAVCTGQALTFPSERYTTCRYQLAEQRQRKHWLELSLAQQQSALRTPDYMPMPPPGTYVAMDPERFQCAAEGSGADEVILCRVR